jgi:hypothetical protein
MELKKGNQLFMSWFLKMLYKLISDIQNKICYVTVCAVQIVVFGVVTPCNLIAGYRIWTLTCEAWQFIQYSRNVRD